MLNNDERYWDINLLNKWFAISSVVFLASMVWTFIDDNDDEFKEFQKEFRKLEIEISEAKLEKELETIKSERIDAVSSSQPLAKSVFLAKSNISSNVKETVLT